jgi:hypothetical protein
LLHIGDCEADDRHNQSGGLPMAANMRSVRVIRGSPLPAEVASYAASGSISATNNRACEGEHTQNKVPTYDRRKTIAGEAGEPVFYSSTLKVLRHTWDDPDYDYRYPEYFS